MRGATIVGALALSLAFGGTATSAPAQPAAIAAAPMKTAGPKPTYPRLTAFPDAGVKRRVNALLAAKEKDDRSARTDCLAQGKEQKEDAEYSAVAEVTYLSPRFLSVNVVSEYFCGGAYPNNGIETPATFDLATGAEVDWAKLFKPGFLPSAAGETAKPAALLRLYRARYPKDADKDCREAISDGSFGSTMILWLDRKGGLAVHPDFPHVIQACAESVDLPPAALAPYLRDPAVLADLKATVRK